MITVAAQAARERRRRRLAGEDRERLQGQERSAAEHDCGGEEAVRIEADQLRAQAREEPEQAEGAAGQEGRGRVQVRRGPRIRARQCERHVCVSECRQVGPRHAAKLQHRSMRPTLVQYDAPGWGVGEIWLDEDGRVFHCELPRPRRTARVQRGSAAARTLRARVRKFFAGKADDFLDVPLSSRTGSTGTAPACCVGSRAARSSPTASSRRSPASRGPRARPAHSAAAARSRRSSPRTASSARTASARYGDLGVDYKRRLLALEGVSL